MWLHFSATQLKKEDLQTRLQRPSDFAYCKPHGLWVTPDNTDDNWPSWCRDNDFRHHGLVYAHEIDLDEKDILFLRNPEELDDFTSQYGDGAFHLGIDWRAVAKEHKGIIITPYQWRRRLAFHTFWYYGWDCASGCIWDVSAILNVRIQQLEEA